MEDSLKPLNNKKEQLEFIDFVLSIQDDDLPLDKSVQIDMTLLKIDELEECMEERFDIIERKLNTIMKYLDGIKK